MRPGGCCRVTVSFLAGVMADCWFCLGSAQVEKHLVVSIVSEVGMLSTDLVCRFVLSIKNTHIFVYIYISSRCLCSCTADPNLFVIESHLAILCCCHMPLDFRETQFDRISIYSKVKHTKELKTRSTILLSARAASSPPVGQCRA